LITSHVILIKSRITDYVTHHWLRHASSSLAPYPLWAFPLFLIFTAPSDDEYMALSNPPTPPAGGGLCRRFRNIIPKANSPSITMTAISRPTIPPVDSPLSANKQIGDITTLSHRHIDKEVLGDSTIALSSRNTTVPTEYNLSKIINRGSWRSAFMKWVTGYDISRAIYTRLGVRFYLSHNLESLHAFLNSFSLSQPEWRGNFSLR
jgi:hypothetical protein